MRLPFEGDGADVIGALWFAVFLNLLAVALVAPLLGLLVRRRRRDLPFMIARDYAGTALLGLITVGLVAGGLAHRSALAAERADQRAVSVAVHRYIVANEPAFAGGVVDTVRLEPESYRACVDRPREAADLLLRQHRPVAGGRQARPDAHSRTTACAEPGRKSDGPLGRARQARWPMRLVPSSGSGQAVRLGGLGPSLGAAASLARRRHRALAAGRGAARRPGLARGAGGARKARPCGCPPRPRRA